MISVTRAKVGRFAPPFQLPQKQQTLHQRDGPGEQHAKDHLLNILKGLADTAATLGTGNTRNRPAKS